MANFNCQVSQATLIAAPYNIAYNTGIYCQIIATNAYGDSPNSSSGNGAIMILVPNAPIDLLKTAAGSSQSVISFTWTPASFDGGSPVIDYQVSWDQGTGSFVILQSGVLTASYTTTVTLTPGNTYAFKVKSRNLVGFSVASSSLTVLAAQISDVPAAPTTTISGAFIIVTWTAPYNGATAITAYSITIKTSDGVSYLADEINCNGATPSIIASRSCTIPVGTLTTTPFNLPWGASIYAKVSATNVIGTSTPSVAGNGAVMLTSPDAPINLANVPAITSAS
jgi:hypothetical protein